MKSYLLTEVFDIEKDNSAVFNHSENFNDAAEIENLCKKNEHSEADLAVYKLMKFS